MAVVAVVAVVGRMWYLDVKLKIFGFWVFVLIF